MSSKKNRSRRQFIKTVAAGSASAAITPTILKAKTSQQFLEPKRYTANDKIRLATIGMGIIGFIDTETALRVPGVELVAVADLYDGRRTRAQEVYGSHIFTTRDYREILQRDDVDAVIVATSDHWHAQIAIDAMEAEKHVYCEKPMVRTPEEGRRVIEAEKKTGKVLEVGSQGVSSILNDKARQLFEEGAIGELNFIEASFRRNSDVGAWQYSIPPDASPQNVDWERFLGEAPKRPFDATRFFRWRNYTDYGTGIPGDLFVHLFSAVHHILTSHGPTRISAMGGLRFWKDGRDVPDVIAGLFDFPQAKAHPAFTLALTANFVDNSSGPSGTLIIGSEGMMRIQGSRLTLEKRGQYKRTEQEYVEGYNSVRTFSEATQRDFVEEYRQMKAAQGKPESAVTGVSEYQTPEGYDARLDHFYNFFSAIRENGKVEEDATYGLRAAAPAVLTNTAYADQRIVNWDPEKLLVGN